MQSSTTVAALGVRHAPLAQAEGDVLRDRQPGEQRVGLEHHAAVGAGPGDRLAIEQRPRPSVGLSSPATMRSSVDLPQPDGPRMVTNSLSATTRSVGSSARVGAPPRTPGKTRETLSMTSLLTPGSRETARRLHRLEQEVGDQPDHADDDDAEDHLAGAEQRLAVDDHVADAGGRADQLGDDHVGPGPAEHEAQDLGDLRRGGGDQHAPHDAAVARAERVGGLDQIAPRRADGDRHHQDDLEDRADEDDEQLLRLADAGPQDQQRDEGRGRQVAREGDERLEERLDRLVGAHQRCRAARRPARPARSRRPRARW